VSQHVPCHPEPQVTTVTEQLIPRVKPTFFRNVCPRYTSISRIGQASKFNFVITFSEYNEFKVFHNTEFISFVIWRRLCYLTFSFFSRLFLNMMEFICGRPACCAMTYVGVSSIGGRFDPAGLYSENYSVIDVAGTQTFSWESILGLTYGLAENCDGGESR
jgi:hypothetical protein